MSLSDWAASAARRLGVRVYTRPTYDRGCRIAMHAASERCSQLGVALGPEQLLLMLLVDPDVRDGLVHAEGAEKEAEAEAHTDRGETRTDGWTAEGMAALRLAWERAALRASRSAQGTPAIVTRGDLLSGLAGSSGFAGNLLRSSAIDYEELDEDVPLLASEDLVHIGLDDDTASVVLLNDDRTPMAYVTGLLRERLGHPQTRAVYLMYRIHFCQAAAVAERERAEAIELADRLRAHASRYGHPLQVKVVASSAAPTRLVYRRPARR